MNLKTCLLLSLKHDKQDSACPLLPLPAAAAASGFTVEEQVLLGGFLFSADTAAAFSILKFSIKGLTKRINPIL